MVTTRLSSKGQVVLPRLIRSTLGLAPGTELRCEVKGDSVILTPQGVRKKRREHVTDPVSGLRVTKSEPGAERVSSEMVKALLEDFP
jgi:AbrB family looped-hinge helix DNA binding protein